MTYLQLFVAALVGGALNAVAGGGSFIALPALLSAGVPPVAANATSAFALWPGSLSSALAYRREIAAARQWLIRLGAVSLLGGLLGGWLLVRTSDLRFLQLLPWLMLAAAITFTIGGRVADFLRRRTSYVIPVNEASTPSTSRVAHSTADPAPRTPHSAPGTPHSAPGTPHPAPGTPHPVLRTAHPAPGTPHPVLRTAHPAPGTPHPALRTAHPAPHTAHPAPRTPHSAPVWILVFQFVIAIYGGYFGGGMGIVMLAAFSVAGMTEIHEMNGIKALLAVLINAVALVAFIASGVVVWAPGLVMVVGGTVGGYYGAFFARRIDAGVVRMFVIAVAWIMTAYFFLR